MKTIIDFSYICKGRDGTPLLMCTNTFRVYYGVPGLFGVHTMAFTSSQYIFCASKWAVCLVSRAGAFQLNRNIVIVGVGDPLIL